MTATDTARLAKLRERAERLSRATESSPRQAELEVAVLGSADDRLAVPVAGLREIVRTPPVTRLPSLPDWILGLVQIRGELLCVVEPSSLLGTEPHESGRLLAVVELRGRAVGLVADRLLEQRMIYRDELADSLGSAVRSSGLIRATTRDLLPILDTERLLADPRLVVGAPSDPHDDPETVHPDPPTE